MVSLVRGILQSRKDILAFQKRVIPQDFLVRCPRPKQLEHIRHTNALPADTGSAPALVGFNGDSIEAV